jgi:hypothetical protein
MRREKEKKRLEEGRGRWTQLEHCKFVEAYKAYGKKWNEIQKIVPARTN